MIRDFKDSSVLWSQCAVLASDCIYGVLRIQNDVSHGHINPWRPPATEFRLFYDYAIINIYIYIFNTLYIY